MLAITRNLDKQTARKTALSVFEIVNRYLLELDRIYPEFNKKFTITMFGKIELAIKNIRPITFQNEIDEIIQMVSTTIINVRPKISQRLNKFWNAHLEMAEISSKTDIQYEPMTFVEASQDEILKILTLLRKFHP